MVPAEVSKVEAAMSLLLNAGALSAVRGCTLRQVTWRYVWYLEQVTVPETQKGYPLWDLLIVTGYLAAVKVKMPNFIETLQLLWSWSGNTHMTPQSIKHMTV